MGSLKLLVASLALTAAAPGAAATLLYTISGAYSASFKLDTNPLVVTDPSDPDSFTIYDVPGTFGGHTGLGGLIFYSFAAEGGLSLTFLNPDTNFYDIPAPVGIQLYTGPIDHPTLLAFGPTSFVDFDDRSRSYIISAVSVPEPASWALLIAGFALAGGSLRQRRTGKKLASA